jgi:hypothetical protein
MLWPLLYDFPHAAHLHQIEDQVMIGPQLMVAPVCQPGARRGGYAPAAGTISLCLHLPEPPTRVLLDGRDTDTWRWEETNAAVNLRLPDDGEAHEIEQLRD